MNPETDLERTRASTLADRGNGGSTHAWSILSSLGLGAALMYFFDPERGRRRRALVRDQFVHAGRMAREAQRVTAVDVSNRANGLWAESTRRLRAEGGASDAEIVERVRAKLGRVVSHPHAIGVSVREGCVTLSGPILAHEVQPLLSCARKVPGVRSVEDRLAAHAEAGRISALQGGRTRVGDRFELLQTNWSPTARLLTGAIGAGLMLLGARERSALNLGLSLVGGGLLLRAATNREFATLFGAGENCRGIEVQKSINVKAPVERVFSFWRDYQNFPLFMTNVRDVRPVDGQRSHWTVSGPAGASMEWISEITNVVPNESIEWRSEPGSGVRHRGRVRFQPNGNGGTRVDIHLCYVPLAGAIGHAVAKFFGADPKSEMDADLMRMKTMIETGHRPHDAARPARPAGEAVRVAAAA